MPDIFFKLNILMQYSPKINTDTYRLRNKDREILIVFCYVAIKAENPAICGRNLSLGIPVSVSWW